MIIVFWFAPLVCWLLTARTRRMGLIVGAGLSLAAFLQLAAVERWILPDARFTVAVPLSYLIPIGLLAAVVVEGRKPGVSPLRRSGPRGVVGLVAVSAYAVAAALGLAAAGWLLAVEGPWYDAPTRADMLLPAGLVATAGWQGCYSGSQATCQAEVDVTGAPAASGADVAGRLRDFAATRGWRLVADGPNLWDGCRDEGVLLDRHPVCAEVSATDAAHASLRLEVATNGWS